MSTPSCLRSSRNTFFPDITGKGGLPESRAQSRILNGGAKGTLVIPDAAKRRTRNPFLNKVNMDSGLAPFGAPGNDQGGSPSRSSQMQPAFALRAPAWQPSSLRERRL